MPSSKPPVRPQRVTSSHSHKNASTRSQSTYISDADLSARWLSVGVSKPLQHHPLHRAPPPGRPLCTHSEGEILLAPRGVRIPHPSRAASVKERGRVKGAGGRGLAFARDRDERGVVRARDDGVTVCVEVGLSLAQGEFRTRFPRPGGRAGSAARHLFAPRLWVHGAVRPRPSRAQSDLPAAPALAGSHAARRARWWSCPSTHAATAALSRRQRISPSRRP
jgi:hypothetical protein